MRRRNDSIALSQQHGLNPAIPKCYYCLEDKNEIILAGRLPKDAEAPRGAVWDKAPCDKCRDYMAQGIICISVRDDGGPPSENPYRTGRWAVVKEEAFQRIFGGEPAALAVKLRYAFVTDEMWAAAGLP